MDQNRSNILASWFKKFQQFKVSYKDGCYHLNNLFHSPETIVESFDKMPFCKHYREQKHQVCNNIFVKSTMYYCQLDEGLWVMLSNLHFKKTVLMRNLYDENLPLDYHFINIHVKATRVVNKSLVNGMLLKNQTWSLFKAGKALTEYHFKNSEEKNVTIFFTSKWLEQQKKRDPKYQKSKLSDFFDSDNNSLILDDTQMIYEDICDQLMVLANDGVDKNEQLIREWTTTILNNFIEKLDAIVDSENHFKLSDKDQKNIQLAEQFLNNHLFGDFPGIENIAKKVGISPTKLKSDFKNKHGESIYQYFRFNQLSLAHEFLKQGKHTIKEIATIFGYENASKFSAAFKNVFGVNPSEINTNEDLRE